MARVVRPDLEMLPYKEPNFIAGMLMPEVMTDVKASKLYFQDIESDISVQTARSIGSEATENSIVSANVDYTVDEKIARIKIPESEIEMLGGLDAAQAKAARLGKRAVMGQVEVECIRGIFGGTGYLTRDILNSFLQALDIAVETIADYADGQIAVFGARKVINRLKRYDEIKDKMVYTGMINSEQAKDVRHISDDILAGAIGVDKVLAGPSSTSFWLGGSSAYDGYLGVAVLPDAGVDPDEEIQFARTMKMPVGEGDNNMFKVETYFSDEKISEMCDVRCWTQPQFLNKECCYILTGIDEGNATTTTAS